MRTRTRTGSISFQSRSGVLAASLLLGAALGSAMSLRAGVLRASSPPLPGSSEGIG